MVVMNLQEALDRDAELYAELDFRH